MIMEFQQNIFSDVQYRYICMPKNIYMYMFKPHFVNIYEAKLEE